MEGVKKEKASTILKELIAKAKKDELVWKEELYSYVTTWKGVRIKLSKSEPFASTYKHFSLDAGVLEWEPLFPIWGELHTRELLPLEESPFFSSPQYSISKEGPYDLLKWLHNVVEEKQEDQRWLYDNPIEIVEEIIQKLTGVPPKDTSPTALQREIIEQVFKKIKQIEWKIDQKESQSSIYTPYIGYLEGLEVKVRRSVINWFFLFLKSSEELVTIHGDKKRGFKNFIPDKKTRFYDDLKNLYSQVDKRYRGFASKKRTTEIKEKSSSFLSLLRDC